MATTTKRLNAHLSDKQITILKDHLLAEAERLRNSFMEKKNEYLSENAENKDEVDSANDNILISTTMRFSKRDNFYHKKIVKALEKLDCHEYGMCEDCQAPISFERLKARPTSELCINCKEEQEMYEKQNAVLRKSKSLGETFQFNA
jgi:DnaK suppressor protein